MNVLVTGGAGSLGRPVVAGLTRLGHDVVVLGRHPQPGAADASVVVEQGDVRDGQRVEALIREHRVAVVVHLAAALGREAETIEGLDVNVRGASTVFDAARRMGVERIVSASSMAVYGPARGVAGYPAFEPIREDHPTRPNSWYGVAKRAAEEAGRVAADRGGPAFCAVRFGPYYGPDKPVGGRRGIGALLTGALRALAEGEPVRLPTWAGYRIHPLYVLDAAAAVVAATVSPTLPNHADPWVHVAGPEVMTMAEAAEAFRRERPDADVRIVPSEHDADDADARSSCIAFDDGRARTVLGYRPRFDLAQATHHFLAGSHTRTQIERSI